ncbi:YpdA family putative bacillithiol disulfide reductase [Brevibacillus daliensis]|uniref:YpdA family putative bacillithiol disulfide reductase n=1 Tax=Brevibacillus daliensis TaxID=2892995 RepID=UPI001E4998D3|nr:YpdA family putative bacillithiol disulfide reductase [Brevibacillus daliensis]
MEDIIVVGAGPCGLSCAVELKKLGFHPLLIDKGSIVHSIYKYPTYMIFHSTPELLEIGDIPFSTPNEKPTRQEALTYYRLVAERYQLPIHTFEEVTSVNPVQGHFTVTTRTRSQETKEYQAKQVVVATGYFDNPNKLGIPGEELSKVSSFYTEAHPYSGCNVTIIGGNNSAVDAALDLGRAGAKVTVVCRGDHLSERVKAWTKPVFESKCQKGHIRMIFSSRVISITENAVLVETPSGVENIENDFVFSLIGYRPDRKLLQEMGVKVDLESGAPVFNEESMETNIPGLYVAGVIVSGRHVNEIFIENGRFHGKLIAEHLIAGQEK